MIFDEECLRTNLIPKYKSAMKGSYQLEKFLTQLERYILAIVWDTEMIEKKEKYQEMRRLLQRSEESEILIVPTDKTNSFRSTRKINYTTMVVEHLRKSAREMDIEKVTEIFDYAKVLVDEIGFIISNNEVGKTNESLKQNLYQHPKS